MLSSSLHNHFHHAIQFRYKLTPFFLSNLSELNIFDFISLFLLTHHLCLSVIPCIIVDISFKLTQNKNDFILLKVIKVHVCYKNISIYGMVRQYSFLLRCVPYIVIQGSGSSRRRKKQHAVANSSIYYIVEGLAKDAALPFFIV